MYLVGLVVDAVNKRIGSHSYIEVGVAQPLNGFFDVGHSSQSHLTVGGKQNESICIRQYRYDMQTWDSKVY